MIYITGDCHRDFVRFTPENFPEQKDMTKEDYVIICGDFGGVWSFRDENAEEAALLNKLNDLPFTLLFVDGNHENFDRLYAYPEEEWHGGKVHVIRPSVLHLMRGQVFEIDGASFFTFGGASSHDISAGVLDPDDTYFEEKKEELQSRFIFFRINHFSWWKEELPSEEEMEEGRKNLLAHNYEVDFIVSHCCSSNTQATLSRGAYVKDRLTDYFDEIRDNTKFKKWFFGHYHDNQMVYDDEILIYEQIIRIK